MFKVMDYVVLAVFVIALVVLCFLQQCGLDIYFLVLGFTVVAMCAFTKFWQERKESECQQFEARANTDF